MTFGKKKVIACNEQYCGVIIELTSSGVVAKEYQKNEFNEYVTVGESFELDLAPIHKMNKPLAKVRQISSQLGHGNYVISENVIELLSR